MNYRDRDFEDERLSNKKGSRRIAKRETINRLNDEYVRRNKAGDEYPVLDEDEPFLARSILS